MLTIYSIGLGILGIINGFSSFVTGEEEIRTVFQKCCEIGRDAAEYAKCEANRPVPGIAPDHQSLCLSALELCCAQVVREVECAKGMDSAKSDGPCLDGLQGVNQQNPLDKGRCCQSCKLGLLSAVLGQTCDLGTTSFGKLWDSAFIKCCEGTQKDEKKDAAKEGEGGKNMCQALPNELCHHDCVPSGQSYKCTCRPGWTLMSDGKSCAPTKGKCVGCSDQDCTETPTGEMFCINCPQQYHLDADNKTCVRDDEKPQTCPDGYRKNHYSTEDVNICEDIDECVEGLDECGANKNCVNTIGSYKCTAKVPPVRCRRGYTFSHQHGSCVDVDECAEIEDPPCDSNQNCINTNGSFECQCKTGFKQDPVTLACVDINECQQKIHNCVEYQRCDNTIGSFVCVRDVNCGTGYTLNSQSGKCEDDDECTLGTDTCHLLGQDWECRNTQGSFRCVKRTECATSHCSHATHHCPSGYRVTGSTCVDINECEEGIARCGPNQRCINIKGNYLCSDIVSCKPGLRLNEAKTQCIDIDECSEQQGLCSHYCDNRWGTYRCRCKPGFKLHIDNRTCVDINECEDGPRCQGYCINQQGSYSCSCPPGYRTIGYKKQLCEDINECQGSDKVCNDDDICINIAGSYRCNQINCLPGYRRDGVQRNRCQKEDTRCLHDDLECRRQPTTYSYNFIAMVSNYTIPRGGGLKLFTISSSWSSTAPDFTYELVQARVPAGVKAATRNDFNLNKQYGKATIELLKPLIGPQEIQLELKTEFYKDGTILATQISSLEIFVSMYTF